MTQGNILLRQILRNGICSIEQWSGSFVIDRILLQRRMGWYNFYADICCIKKLYH